MWYEGILARGWVPDRMLRHGIRRRLSLRLREEAAAKTAFEHGRQHKLIEQLRNSPIALDTDAANEQHYELPPAFFQRILGRHLKYSSGYWPHGVQSLDDAEEQMLELYLERADIHDGMDILDLGCGWGSFALWASKRLPASRILAVSNSNPQQEFIRGEAQRRAISNLETLRADVNRLELPRSFDRIISIEMFEHVRNYRELMRILANALHPDGKLFVHIFCHRQFAYPFEERGNDDWMARHFFTGGLMPSQDLLGQFQEHLSLQQQWQLNGAHYGRTAEAWLCKLDDQSDALRPILASVYGAGDVDLWLMRWRLFFMACAELFNYAQGQEWFVSHYLFGRK